MKIFKDIFAHKEYRLLLLILVLFSLLRIPSLNEPYWYGDEGIYQVIGNAINHGRILYRDIWDNKPPLLYITYAILGSDQFLVRFTSLLFGIGSVIAFFYLSQKLFKNTLIIAISTFSFAYLFGIPSLEGNIANSENFMLLPIILAGLIIYSLSNKTDFLHEKNSGRQLLAAGLLLGTALLFKIVAIFDIAAFSIFLIFFINKHFRISSEFKQNIFHFVIGIIGPISITSVYFILNGAFADFINALFFKNISYVGYKNQFLIPQGLLVLKILVLLIAIFSLWIKRNVASMQTKFILIWTLFSIFNVFFSQRPYTHYLLVIIPSLCLLPGLFIHSKSNRSKAMLVSLSIVIIISIGFVFRQYSFTKLLIYKPFNYYKNYTNFISGNKSLKNYYYYFDSDVPGDNELADYVKMINKTTTAFFWGNTAQLYTLSDTLPPGRYTVAYHINTPDAVGETLTAIHNQKPQLIILLDDSPPLPFPLNGYNYKATVNNASIYEREFF